MKKFNIYTHELLPTQIVKEGWGWPSFFFNTFWALVKKMWGVFFISWGVYIFAYGIALFIFSTNLDEFSLADLVPIAFAIIFGMEGNSWRVNKLNKLGYIYSDTINAQNYKIALNKYRAKTPSTKQESPSKTNKKVTGSPGITIDSDGIVHKNKDSWSYKQAEKEISTGKVDSSILAESQASLLNDTSRNINSIYIEKRIKALEKKEKKPSSDKVNSPPIEEEVSEKPKFQDVKPKEAQKSATKVADNNSEYVEKLKEAKSLLDADLINKADYEKIKKKIIDSL